MRSEKTAAAKMIDALRHLVVIRLAERGESMPEQDVELISLGLLFDLERRIRNLPTP